MKRYYRDRRHSPFRKFKRHDQGLKTRLASITSRNGLYRSRRGIFMGVCKGMAEHFNFNVFWTRIIVLILFLFTGFWPVGVLYLVAGLLLKPAPVSPLRDEKDHEFYDTYIYSRNSAIQRIKRKFNNIERRIQRMEHSVTSKEFDW